MSKIRVWKDTKFEALHLRVKDWPPDLEERLNKLKTQTEPEPKKCESKKEE
jgi:hypothetical protein